MRHIAFPWTPFLFTPRLTAQCHFFIFSTSYKNYSTTAKISISTRTAFGRSLTATHERAGLLVKYFSYTALNAAKSAISARKHVVLTAFSKATSCFFQYFAKILHNLLCLSLNGISVDLACCRIYRNLSRCE